MRFIQRLSEAKVIAKLRDMLAEDALTSSKLLISSPEEDRLLVLIPETDSAFVFRTTDFSMITHENLAGSYLIPGRDNITINCTQNPSLQPKLTGETELHSYTESLQETSHLRKQGI
jgi:translation elongation factor EF-Tu-like GTPase